MYMNLILYAPQGTKRCHTYAAIKHRYVKGMTGYLKKLKAIYEAR